MYANKHHEDIHKHDFLTKELLEEEYLVNKLTDKQIAAKYNISSKVIIWKKRKEFGIKNRFAGKSNKNASKNRLFDITKEKAEEILLNGKIQDVADFMGCKLIVAKRRLKELGLSKKQEHTEHYNYWNIELSDRQKQMIIGSTLGDGTITKHGAYSCSHSIKQAEYHKYKREVLSNIFSGKFRHSIHKQKDIHGNFYESLFFTTGCNKFCAEMRPIYYPNDGKKVFPYNFIAKNIDPEGLAYWYMDDGSLHGKSAKLCTYAWSFYDQLYIQKMFNDKFSLKAKIRYRRERNDFFIEFLVAETTKFFNLIRQFIIPSMKYKIGG